MKIYTKTGDAGETGLFAGPRVSKDHARIEAYGTVDELNAVLGWVRAESQDPETDQLLETIQNALFAVGAELATPDPASHGTQWIGDSQIQQLEQWIDRLDGQLPVLQHFILPAGTRAAASVHLARAVCRRAERCLVTLIKQSPEPVSSCLLVYLNRLSDLLFVLARWMNQQGGHAEVQWQRP